MFGKHLVKAWSLNQSVIALSSGEAEYYALVKGACEMLGMQSMLRDMGESVGIGMKTDSAAAVGMCSRRGLGKVRHLDTQLLWLQAKIESKAISLSRVPGYTNLSDVLTKHVEQEICERHTKSMNVGLRAGRAHLAPELEAKPR